MNGVLNTAGSSHKRMSTQKTWYTESITFIPIATCDTATYRISQLINPPAYPQTYPQDLSSMWSHCANWHHTLRMYETRLSTWLEYALSQQDWYGNSEWSAIKQRNIKQAQRLCRGGMLRRLQLTTVDAVVHHLKLQPALPFAVWSSSQQHVLKFVSTLTSDLYWFLQNEWVAMTCPVRQWTQLVTCVCEQHPIIPTQ